MSRVENSLNTIWHSAIAIFMLGFAATACDGTRGYVRGATQASVLVAGEGEFVWLDTIEGRLGGRAFLSAELNEDPVLAIVLHGDRLEPDDSYHYVFAQTVASEVSNAILVGLLRPGYRDEQGNRSDGDILTATGDNYTREVVDAVADATRQLKDRYKAAATVLIGHSGGAAIAALVLGNHPEVADAALLLACPCDLQAWRTHMMTLRPSPVWQRPHQGLSPLDSAAGVPSTSIVELLVGDEDDVVRIEYSDDYASALRARDVEARVTVLPGLGHNILLQPAVVSEAIELITRVEETD